MGCGSSSPEIRSKTPTPKPSPPRTPTPPPPTPPRTPTPPPPPPTPPPPPLERESTADFASDCIDIKIDKAKDEKEIVAQEDGYNEPSSGDQVDGKVKKKKDIWYEDDDFNNASDDADLFKPETDDTDIDDLETLSDTASLILNPTRSAKPTLAFEEVDDHAKQASPSLLYDFNDLLQYLKKPFDKDSNRKLKIARAIVVWMSYQKFENEDYGEATTDTPRGLIQYLKEERMTYATCYAILCRKAGLQCSIIKGYVKAAGYEPGHTDIPESPWNAVYVECGWQIVHPFWICRALYGSNLGGWVKVEVDGTSVVKKETASKGIVRSTFQERYFMPDPAEFMYECAAIDSRWQLVNNAVLTKEHFIEMPYLLPPFFGVGFELISEPKCVLECRDGFCNIKMKGRPANAHMIMLSYELFLKNDDSGPDIGRQRESNMARMVFNSRAKEVFDFEIRFPNPGTYKLVIYGGPYKCPRLRLCEFKLICHKGLGDRVLLPLECNQIGWGPGPVSVEEGLLIPSRINGLIPVSKSEKKCTIKFQIKGSGNDFIASIHGKVEGKSYDDNLKIDVKPKEFYQLQITASLPSEGEFGLSIHKVTTSAQEQQPGRNVCNYLLSTVVGKMTKANVRFAKRNLEECISKDVVQQNWKMKIKETEYALEKCMKVKIPVDDDDIVAANTALNFLRCKDRLRDCKLRNNLNVTRKTLQLVNRYSYKSALTKEIEAIKTLEKKQVDLKECSRMLPTLIESFKEVAHLQKTDVEVVEVCRSLLLILGEADASDMDWPHVQKRLQNISTRDKMNSVLHHKLKVETRQTVMENLGRFDESRLRSVSCQAHSFYIWMTKIINSQEAI